MTYSRMLLFQMPYTFTTHADCRIYLRSLCTYVEFVKFTYKRQSKTSNKLKLFFLNV